MADPIGDYGNMDTEERDFPANASTPGLARTGWIEYGVVNRAGDVDWFKISLVAGQQYRFQIEASSTNGLFDPQLALYSSGGTLITTATIGQGFQSKYIDYTAPSTADFFLSASGPSSLTGYYKVSVPIGTTGTPGSGSSTTQGTSGNDMLTGTTGNDFVDGAAGVDTLSYSGQFSNFTITSTSSGFTVKDNAGAEGTDTLVGVERLKFSDKSIALDINGNGGQVYRIYQAAFNRAPDLGGLGDWIYGMDTGMSLLQVADGFIASAEFKALYGANPTTQEYVTRLYNNVLHRAPEQAGFDYWVNQIDGGYQTRNQVLTGFSESPENQNQIIGVIQNGFEYTLHQV